MTLKQQSFLRGTKSFTIEDGNLRCSFHSFSSDHQFGVSLQDIRPTIDEYRRVAWSWYLIGFVALGFVASQFRSGVHLDLFDATIVFVYLATAIFTLSAAIKRSGRFLILKSGGDESRAIWKLRQNPSRQSVDSFLTELKTEMQKTKETGPLP